MRCSAFPIETLRTFTSAQALTFIHCCIPLPGQLGGLLLRSCICLRPETETVYTGTLRTFGTNRIRLAFVLPGFLSQATQHWACCKLPLCTFWAAPAVLKIRALLTPRLVVVTAKARTISFASRLNTPRNIATHWLEQQVVVYAICERLKAHFWRVTSSKKPTGWVFLGVFGPLYSEIQQLNFRVSS